ncbi:porin family protein [Bacteroides fragilis]|nr:porin family protein [Bacteroides fragilis]
MGAQQFHLIPKVGLNLANTTGEVDSKVRPGLNVGLGGDVMLTERFGIEAGVYYSMQGSKYNGNGVSYTDKLDYINIPVYAKEFIYKGLYLFGGPQFSFNVNSENKASSDHATTVIGMNVIRTFDCGVGLGAGYQFERGLLVSLNYNIGLINVNKAWASNSNPKATIV